ncbi:MAG TPA: HAD family hydrolase [Bryobacteraceae bacterium]|nr:HAD family hydrolase [Bryobacteraceae bacterium]
MHIERVRDGASAARARVALFDFDGTISTIRSGWIDVMAPMMVEILVDLNTGESEADLERLIREMIWRTTGKETIYQMMDFAAEVSKRGGAPCEPIEYKKMYLYRLWQHIAGRIEDLRGQRVAPERYMVPGARNLIEALRKRGLKMYLASGTDEIFMREEARLLGVAGLFDGGVYGAQEDYRSFSKKILIQRILSGTDVRGAEIVCFGDGYVEIEETKLAGGVTVGVATKEPECVEIDDWKRERLIGVGADFVVPNFLAHDELIETLFQK